MQHGYWLVSMILLTYLLSSTEITIVSMERLVSVSSVKFPMKVPIDLI